MNRPMVAAVWRGIATRRSRGRHAGLQRRLDLLGADALAQVALERAEQVGEVLGERVVGLVGQRQQPDLAAQLAVVALEVDEHPQRDAADVDADLVRRRRAGRPGGRLAGDDALDHLVAGLGRRVEPDDLAVVLDLDAPGRRAAGDDAQAAAEGEQQVVVVGGLGGRQDAAARASRRGPRPGGAPGCRAPAP